MFYINQILTSTFFLSIIDLLVLTVLKHKTIDATIKRKLKAARPALTPVIILILRVSPLSLISTSSLPSIKLKQVVSIVNEGASEVPKTWHGFEPPLGIQYYYLFYLKLRLLKGQWSELICFKWH